MRVIRLLLVLFICAVPAAARADSIPLSGILTRLPGETVTYDLTVTSTFVPLFGGEVDDRVSGSALIFDKQDVLLATQTFDFSNLFVFQAFNDQIVLAEFGVFTNTANPWDIPQLVTKYDFVATGLNQISLEFTSAGSQPETIAAYSTPQPPVWLLLIGGVGPGLLGMLARTQKHCSGLPLG